MRRSVGYERGGVGLGYEPRDDAAVPNVQIALLTQSPVPPGSAHGATAIGRSP